MLDWKYGAVTFWSNTVNDYLVAAGVFVLLWLVQYVAVNVLTRYLGRLAERSSTKMDDALVEAIGVLGTPFYSMISLYVAVQALTLPRWITRIIAALALITVTAYGAHIAGMLVARILRNAGDEATESSMLLVISRIAKGIIWVIAVLFILSNLGVKITSLVASLGIGGIAIAIALQNILSDIFASFSIYFDRPFEVGDFIIVGDDMGTVKHIGLKSTRLEALRGEEIVLSNEELTSTRINNFKKMEKRRAEFSFGVRYDTPLEKVEQIPEMVRDVIDSTELAECDRVHFKSFAESSLLFEVVYYVSSKEYNDYMDTQEHINLEIMRRFEDEDIEFAFPTRTVHMEE